MNKKKVFKKFIIYFFLSFFLSSFLTFIYIFFPKSLDSIDNRIRDYFFTIRGEIPNSNSVVIIDIDEKSLKEIGQWPWSRDIVSTLLQKMTNKGIGIIGFDIVFPEEDNSSPHKIFKKFGIEKKELPNYDIQLAQTIAQTPTILGYQFQFKQDAKYLNKKAPDIPAIFVEKNKDLGSQHLIKATGTILNIPQIQQSAYSSGFFNNIPDVSGIVRSVPLVISYNDMIYPSLSLEILRIITDTKKVIINYDNHGVSSVSLNQIEIPTDRHGRLLINYRGKERNFKYISAVDILNDKIKDEEIEGKVALIGTSAAGLLDLRATPFESVFPGVEVHANVIDNILVGDFISKESWIDGANIALIFLLSFLIVFLITFTPFWFNPFISLIFISSTSIFLYKMLFDYGIILNILFPLITIVTASIFATLFDYFYEIKQEEAIKKKFASKVSKEVMDNLLKNIDTNEFQAMEKEITIFFSDIRGFTKISEEMNDAKKLISYLNQYMEPMSNIITKYQGTIDKYIGDAIMAYWNAPADVENHADKALKASIEQINQIKVLNKQLEKDNKPLIKIGIGINSGIAIVGEMGSVGRSDYTVIGDTINLGSRVESLCKYYDSSIIITQNTKDLLKENYTFRFLDLVKVKGKDEAISLWQVYEENINIDLKNELDKYHEAINLYKNCEFESALKIFEELECLENKNNNNIYKIYTDRCKEYIKHPPSNFDGVFTHNNKG